MSIPDGSYFLLRLLVQGMLATMRTIFLDLHPVWIIATVLFRRVIAVLALIACKSDHRSDILLF